MEESELANILKRVYQNDLAMLGQAIAKTSAVKAHKAKAKIARTVPITQATIPAAITQTVTTSTKINDVSYCVQECTCGGQPIVSIVRPYKTICQGINKPVLVAYKLTKHKLGGQDLQLEAQDILAAYCSECEQRLDIEETA